ANYPATSSVLSYLIFLLCHERTLYLRLAPSDKTSFTSGVMQRLLGKTAVVTGAGRGIGNGIAHRLASEGARVILISRSPSSCGGAADQINAEFPDSCKAYPCDVADYAAVQETAALILKDFPQIDILVNNAGITRDTLMLRMKEEDWDQVLDTNLKSAFNLVKAFQRILMKSPAGRIINMSSVVGLTGNIGQANYAASKAGLIGFTKSLAQEFSSRKVTSNAIAPGFIATEMTAAIPEKVKEEILKKIPLADLGNVEDIAALAAFLASDESRYITGQVIACDGGMSM
ncbi:MAG: 3-oxoacyl-[acyl-carrier-protein] reductase, partial [Akkermansia sp.]